MPLFRLKLKVGRTISIVDLLLILGLAVVTYAMIGVAREWTGPYQPKTEIRLGVSALFQYSFLSLFRVTFAYLLSLVFTFTYGYVAAKSRIAEPILIPLLDILQSVPVLGFMPGLVLALVKLFPNSNLGLELAAIVMIFTGQGWNMVFSFYSSLKAVPSEMREVSSLFRLSKWELLRKVEIPFSANGLLWNSMLSMAGGWFFLMVIESFTLGDKNFRLPGLGSYMAVAYERGDSQAIVLGIIAMFLLIIVVDRVIWAPLVVWSEKFRTDLSPRRNPPRSVILDILKKSNVLDWYLKYVSDVTREIERWRDEKVRERRAKKSESVRTSRTFLSVRYVLVFAGIVGTIWAVKEMWALVSATHVGEWLTQLKLTFYSLLRVTIATLVGSIWTIPLGVFIGVNPKWTSRLQPLVQIVASFPAPMLFPMIIYVLLRMGVGIEFGSIVLMLFASQWYILFNVISGATLIPRQMFEIADIFQVRGLHYWRSMIFPAIFPSLVNGWITAAGGAWNATIVAEFVPYGKDTLMATGIGSSISSAAQTGNYPVLAAGILTMVVTVVLINRLFWDNLYRLAETKFKWTE